MQDISRLSVDYATDRWLIDCFCISRIKEWVDQMQKDLIAVTDTASGLQNLVEVSTTICLIPINAEVSEYPYIYKHFF